MYHYMCNNNSHILSLISTQLRIYLFSQILWVMSRELSNIITSIQAWWMVGALSKLCEFITMTIIITIITIIIIISISSHHHHHQIMIFLLLLSMYHHLCHNNSHIVSLIFTQMRLYLLSNISITQLMMSVTSCLNLMMLMVTLWSYNQVT